jgi:hypothetical protein
MNDKLELLPQSTIKNNNVSFVLSTSLNKKFSPRHTNKTGIQLTGLMYDILLKDAGETQAPPVTISDENGFSTLLSAYSNSAINLNKQLTLNLGLNAQLFTLNQHYTIEPRLGIKWQINEKHSLGFAFGMHSRLEKLNYFFIKSHSDKDLLLNDDLDFTKAQHLVLSYTNAISENLSLKIEAYYQHLFNVPVIADSSFSFINLQNDWFLDQKLENSGKGRNYGLDISLEKYLSQGYYFMMTTSLFNSEYRGGDKIWRSTRFNRNFIINLLTGKEWQTGRHKQNAFGLNTRMTLQGGDHYSPVDFAASSLTKNIIYDETQAFSEQLKPSFQIHFTSTYRVNRPNVSHEFAFKILLLLSS